ncbi:MAG: tetratricopeptide repeat protein [Cuniculiplasma sp.]
MFSTDDPKTNLNKFIERFLDSNDKKDKVELVNKIVKLLQSPEYILLIQNDLEIRAKLDTIVRDMWTSLKIFDPVMLRAFYMANRESEICQSIYAKALINEKDATKCNEFLKSNVKIFNTPDILDSIYEMAKLTGLWDYAALLLSFSGIFEENIFRNYLTNSSYVISKEIIKNFKSRKSGRELLKFLKMITTADPENAEYTIDYLEALNANLETPSLVSLLKVVDPAIFTNENLLLRLSRLYVEIGEYNKARDNLQKIISLSPDNQEALELYVESLAKTMEWELIIALISKRRSLLQRSEEIVNFYLQSCVETKNYREAIDFLNQSDSILKQPGKSLIYAIQLYVMSRDVAKAKSLFTKLSSDLANSREGLKLYSEISRLEGNTKEYLSGAKRYINSAPEDSKFLINFLKEMESQGKWKQILELKEKTNQVISKQESIPFFILANLNENRIEDALSLLTDLDFQYIDDRFHKTMLKNMRTNNAWLDFQKNSEKMPIQIRSYLSILKDFIYGNSLKESDLSNVKGYIEGKVMDALIEITEIWNHLDMMEMADVESKLGQISSAYLEDPSGNSVILNYQMINLYIHTGEYEKAGEIIKQIRNQEDPYLTYYSALIQSYTKFNKSIINGMEKVVEILSASPFKAFLLGMKLEDMTPEVIISQTEKLVNDGASLHVPWKKIYEKLETVDGSKLLNFVDLMEFSGTVSLETLRILRSYKLKENQSGDIIKLDNQICQMKRKTESDILNYIMDVKEYGSKEELNALISEYTSLELPPELNGVLGDYYLTNKDPFSAEYYYRKSLAKINKEETRGGLIESLINQRKFEEAQQVMAEIKDKDLFRLKIYEASGNIEQLSRTIKGIEKISLDMEHVLETIVDRYWENKILRNNLLSLLKRTNNTSLGLDISSRLISDQKSGESLEILKLLYRNNPSEIRIISVLIEKLAESGKFEEANVDCTAYLKSSAKREDKREILSRMERINFNNGLYKEVLKLYQAFPDLLNADSIEVIVLTLIKAQEYEAAENLLSKHHQKALSHEKFTSLMGVLKKSENQSEITILSERLMKACIRHNKFLDKREAVVYTKIKVSKIDEIYDFLTSPSNFEGLDPEYLEQQSCRILKNIYKKTGIASIEELTLPIFFLGNGSKDIQTAKIIKDYVDDSYYNYRVKQVPKDPVTIKLLHEAAKLSNLNPFIYSVMFNIGIRGSLRLKAAVQSLDGGMF